MTNCEKVKSIHERNREKYEREQRVIMFARRRAGLTQAQVAAKIFVAHGTMACYECGKLKAPWEVLERVLPELKEMRQQTCEAYCGFAQECKDGRCRYRTKGMTQRRMDDGVENSV